MKASDLAGWRNDQVFIQGALHVPLSKEAVRDCMPVLFELIETEPHPAARAILGHPVAASWVTAGSEPVGCTFGRAVWPPGRKCIDSSGLNVHLLLGPSSSKHRL